MSIVKHYIKSNHNITITSINILSLRFSILDRRSVIAVVIVVVIAVVIVVVIVVVKVVVW